MKHNVTALTWARNIPRAWFKILQFYFGHVQEFGQIHPDLPSGRLLDRLSGELEVSLPVGFKDKFNRSYDLMKLELTQMLGPANFERVLIGSFVVRGLQCAAVWCCGWKVGLLVGVLQFVVAPLSLTSCLIRLCTNISDCVAHYLLNLLAVVLVGILKSVLPGLPQLSFDASFVACFFVLDFALNCFVYWHTSEAFEARRLWKHIVYGTFNTKAYFVVVFGCLYGMQFDVLVVLLTGILVHVLRSSGVEKLLLQATRWPCFEVCFYVEHRVGHMPVVYQHAHKMHHYMHDSTPWDAHIYGSGMNEEYFWILAETLPCLLAPGVLLPYFLNPVTLYISWTNKGAHTRTVEGMGRETYGCFDVDNFHADHHTLHRTNFGSSSGAVLDFYFGTTGPTTKGSQGMAYAVRPDPQDEARVLVSVKRAEGYNRAARCTAPADGLCPDEGPVLLRQDWMDRRISRDQMKAKGSPTEGGAWIALHGAVFNVTGFLRGHPGGPQILLSHAGSDATTAYDEVGHSHKATSLALRRYIFGLLDDCEPSGFVADAMAGVPEHRSVGSAN